MEEIRSYENMMMTIRRVEVCKALYITKNGKIISYDAEELIESMKEFNIFLEPDKIELWNNIRKIIYGTYSYIRKEGEDPLVKRAVDNRRYIIIDSLYNYINAGEIMRVYKQTNSWDEVYKTLQEQGHSGWTFSGVALVLKEFSTFGLEFLQRYAPHMIKENKEAVSNERFEDAETEKGTQMKKSKIQN